MKKKFFIEKYLENIDYAAKNLDNELINKLIIELSLIKKKGGRIFFLGIGGSAGNASHAVNDFRKLCKIECYCPTDNASEITARTNDEGFETIFSSYLKNSKLGANDAIFIFSVGGGNLKKKISTNLIKAINYAKIKKSKIFSIVGRNDGYAYKKSHISILIKVKNKKFITPISESFQSILWHLLVSNKLLQEKKTKW